MGIEPNQTETMRPPQKNKILSQKEEIFSTMTKASRFPEFFVEKNMQNFLLNTSHKRGGNFALIA